MLFRPLEDDDVGDETPQGGKPNRDEIFGDKRKEETVMLSGDNMADLVAQARAGATPAADDTSAEPAAPGGAAADAQKKMNTTLLAVAAVGVVLLVIVLVLLLG